MENVNQYIFDFRQIDSANISMVGGKGANLGELSRINGIQVPNGFCISTEAYKSVIGRTSPIHRLLEKLSVLKAEDRGSIKEISGEIRRRIEVIAIPEDIEKEISLTLSKTGEEKSYAVRSSATAEDLPTASFAGQQDTYLNIIGQGEILKHISKCWASLFTERAVMYRLQHGFDLRKVYLSVVVQEMVFPQVSGILFTADPVTANRKVLSIDASFGLGEALVSGKVNPDIYKVREGTIMDKKISNKKLVIYAAKEGGIKQQETEPHQQNQQALTDEQILKLDRVGRTIEAHFGSPQDIEWCLAKDGSGTDQIYIVQSRPITTLYPIPRLLSHSGKPETGDNENHVYVSVGHQQMMTDAMKPLGLSMWQSTASRPMFVGGGRLFVDITSELASPAQREIIINVLGKSDLLVKDALVTIMNREGFIRSSGDNPDKSNPRPVAANFQTQIEYDPDIVPELMKRSQAEIEALRQNIATKSGTTLIDFILEDQQKLRKGLFERKSIDVIMTSMNALFWINEKMQAWLGEKNAGDTLSQSVPNNVTSEMGLALMDVADVIRPYPEVVKYLQQAKDDNQSCRQKDFFEGLAILEGGKKAEYAIKDFLSKYGMRCAGEIDITKTRWSENPITLVPMILSNIKNLAPNAGKQKFEAGLQEALKKEKDLLERLSALRDGDRKVSETKKMINLLRNFAGYREYPKYDIVTRYFIYKQALLRDAEGFVQAGLIRDKEDIYYLTFDELRDVIDNNKLDNRLISHRKKEFKLYEKLTPPRVVTSDGEIITGQYKRDNLPAGAIAGLPVSSGIVEGRARVILKMEDADLEEDDILVTTFTDPSWTPLFVSIKGLITEVGGLMTHGAVIAREFGLPAVVGVDNATKLIRDGQRIRVHGTEGYIEIL